MWVKRSSRRQDQNRWGFCWCPRTMVLENNNAEEKPPGKNPWTSQCTGSTRPPNTYVRWAVLFLHRNESMTAATLLYLSANRPCHSLRPCLCKMSSVRPFILWEALSPEPRGVAQPHNDIESSKWRHFILVSSLWGPSCSWHRGRNAKWVITDITAKKHKKPVSNRLWFSIMHELRIVRLFF